MASYPTLVRKVEAEPRFDVLALDPDSRIVWGVVKAHDSISPDDIEDAAHEFMGAVFKSDPGETNGWDAYPVETGIAPCDFTLGTSLVKAGEWFMGLHVADPDEWPEVARHAATQVIVKDDPVQVDAATDEERLVALLKAIATPPEIHVHFDEGAIKVPPCEHTIHVQPANVEVHPTVQVHPHVTVEAPKPRSVRVEERKGVKRYIPE